MPAQILTARSRQAGGDDAQQAAGVTQEPPGLEHARDGRDSLFSSRAVPMTGVPRTLIGREDRRRWTGSDSIRMTTPSETTLDNGAAPRGRVGVTLDLQQAPRQMVMTTLPRARPSWTCRMAAGVWLSG